MTNIVEFSKKATPEDYVEISDGLYYLLWGSGIENGVLAISPEDGAKEYNEHLGVSSAIRSKVDSRVLEEDWAYLANVLKGGRCDESKALAIMILFQCMPDIIHLDNYKDFLLPFIKENPDTWAYFALSFYWTLDRLALSKTDLMTLKSFL